MSKFLDALGNLTASWQLGIGGARLRSNAGVVESRTADNASLAGFAASQVRSPSVSTPGIRQCILNGSYDTNGQPNALSAGSGLSVSLAASATIPFTLSFAAGFDSNGCVDYLGQYTTNQTFTGLTASTTLYLYVDRSPTTGALTLGFTAAGFSYLFKMPASPTTGQHWFDLTLFQMKQWNGSSWLVVQRVIVGEVTTGASTVTSTIVYAYRGHFASNWITASALTIYTVNHNLGISLASATANLSFWVSATATESDATLAIPVIYVNNAYYGYQMRNGGLITWKALQFFTGDFAMLNTANNWVTTGFYQVRISRGW